MGSQIGEGYDGPPASLRSLSRATSARVKPGPKKYDITTYYQKFAVNAGELSLERDGSFLGARACI